MQGYLSHLKGLVELDEKGNLKSDGKDIKIVLTKSNDKYDYTIKYGDYDEEDAINIVKSMEGEREVSVLYKKSKMQMKHGEYRKVGKWKKETSSRGESSSG